VFTRTTVAPDPEGVRNFVTDALGSTIGLTDATGAFLTTYTYWQSSELERCTSSQGVRGRTATVKALAESCGMKCLNGEIFYSLKEAQVVIEKWRVEYNHQAAAQCARLQAAPGEQIHLPSPWL
jgi:hypothetical protein